MGVSLFHRDCCLPETTGFKKGAIEVADIFRLHRHQLDRISLEQHRVIRDLIRCRTAELGGHIYQCGACGHQEQSYNSCRNRHCPKCQSLAKARWLDKRQSELLPVPYFHLVFTLPSLLNPLIRQNKKIIYAILFQAVSKILLEVAANPKHLGAKIGFLAILHTWGQALVEHPHLHCLIPGGGLASDGSRWIRSRKNFFLPVKVLSKVFRGKFLSALEDAFSQGKLQFHGQLQPLAFQHEFKSLLVKTTSTDWVVYAKAPFGSPKNVLDYLGRYTHRVAISNHRIIELKNSRVSFRHRDYRDGINKTMSLHVTEFMRRFLLHILPKGFVRIRHFGFLSNRMRKSNLTLCRKLLNVTNDSPPDSPKNESWQEVLFRLTGVDPALCPHCKQGRLSILYTLPAFSRGFVFQKWMDSS